MIKIIIIFIIIIIIIIIKITIIIINVIKLCCFDVSLEFKDQTLGLSTRHVNHYTVVKVFV